MWSRQPWMRKRRTTSLAAVVPMLGLIGLGALGVSTGDVRSGFSEGAVNRVTTVDRDCPDFATQAEAQAFFNSQGAGDPHRLDRDGDGRACELNGR